MPANLSRTSLSNLCFSLFVLIAYTRDAVVIKVPAMVNNISIGNSPPPLFEIPYGRRNEVRPLNDEIDLRVVR